jgi:hypothetical protein
LAARQATLSAAPPDAVVVLAAVDVLDVVEAETVTVVVATDCAPVVALVAV